MTKRDLITGIVELRERYGSNWVSWGRDDADKWFTTQLEAVIDQWTDEVIGKNQSTKTIPGSYDYWDQVTRNLEVRNGLRNEQRTRAGLAKRKEEE